MAAESLIADAFEVDLTRPLGGAGGGLPAFAVIDRRDGRLGLMAVQCRRGAPPRAAIIGQLLTAPIGGVLSAIAQGPARNSNGVESWFVICQAPPGAALATGADQAPRAWGEQELLEYLLRPAAHALERMRERNITHRAIRPDNIFRAGPTDLAVLGCAWAGAAGEMQPALYEPPYAAMCVPAGRGDGSVADDVYALGVVLVVLASGRVPMLGMSASEIIGRKLDQGSFAALAAEERLPPMVADLARGMLAEDPEHRPRPGMRVDPAGARARRVASRPPRRAQRPIEIGTEAAWTARTLAFAIATNSDAGVRALRAGAVDRWIRRSLGDGMLAARLEEVARLRGAQGDFEDPSDDALLVARAVAILDPLAPLCWGSVAFWPDGLGQMFAEDEPAGAVAIEVLGDIVETEAIGVWAGVRQERCDPAPLRGDAHRHRAILRQRGWGGGIDRLRYMLNPLLACRSPLTEGSLVVRIADVLPALDRKSARREGRDDGPIDRDLAAFLAARGEVRIDAELSALSDPRRQAGRDLTILRLLAAVQTQTRGAPVPGLAAWLGERVAPALALFQSRSHRRQREAALSDLVRSGRLSALVGVLDDPEAQADDRRGHAAALARVAQIDRQLAMIAANGPARVAMARRIGQECVGGVGALGLIMAILFVLLG